MIKERLPTSVIVSNRHWVNIHSKVAVHLREVIKHSHYGTKLKAMPNKFFGSTETLAFPAFNFNQNAQLGNAAL